MVGREIAMGPPPPTDLNDHLMAFLPNGSAADLAAGHASAAASARPLAPENADVELPAASASGRIKGILAAQCPTSQRGFLLGRILSDSIILLGATARLAGAQERRKQRRPIAVLFDFGSAFPSPSVAFLHQSTQ